MCAAALAVASLSAGLYGAGPAAGAAPEGAPKNPHDVARLDEAGCRVCHLPAREGPAPAPLWGGAGTGGTAGAGVRAVSGSEAAGGGLSAFGAEDPSGPLDPVSHLCLSCHGDDIAPAMAFRRPETAAFDAALPVERGPEGQAHAGRRWPDPRPDLVPKEVVVASGLPLYGPMADRIGCATCHAPHDTGEGVPLRIPNDRSRLCLTCHPK